MSKLKTFGLGGVHPHDRKSRTNGKPIEDAGIPAIAVIPMSQHLGSPADCTVEVGAKVEEGMPIGKSSGFISANIHSPVTGTVKEIGRVFLPNGTSSQAISIEVEESFSPKSSWKADKNWEELSKEELIDLVADMGIVGLGGATFPLNVKLKVPTGSTVEYLIINGVECEPYLTADHRGMLELTDKIFKGIEILYKIMEPEKVFIGIENNKPDAIKVMSQKASAMSFPTEVVPLKLRYPQGDEKQLIQAVTGREIPSGALPLAIGCIVSNVGTVYSLYEAVVLGKPLIERILTVSGGAIKEPKNLRVRIGTPISELIEKCGGFSEVPEKVVVGGPMMGFAIFDLDTPVTKGTSGILALTLKEVNSSVRTSCLNCGKCIQACPMGLNPTTLFKYIDHQDYDGAKDIGLLDCKECGSCGYTCPAHIPLIHGMKLGKLILRKNQQKQNKVKA